MLATVARNRSPKSIPTNYLHKEKTQPQCKKAKCARFIKPVTMVKKVKYKKDDKTVNSINSNTLFTTQKSQDRGENKCTWVIEWNSARYLHLKMCGVVDTFNQQLKKCHIDHVLQKYWHSAMHHTTAMAITIAHDVYLELATEHLTKEAFDISKVTLSLKC